jgi:hypothetical protein
VEQYCITPFIPMLSKTGSFRPMLVFLDIPLALPAIDLIPVSILFAMLYAIVIAPVLSRGDQRHRLGITLWKALSGWWILLVAIAAGGGLYYLLQDHLPKQVGNGIDSFGIKADLDLPGYPSGLLHLRGSMLQLLFAAIGLHILAKRTAIAQPIVQATVVSEAAAADARTILSAPSPAPERRPAQPGRPTKTPVTKAPATPVFPGDPPTCRLTTPPPIPVLIPRPAPGIGNIQPCIVTGSIRPARATPPPQQNPQQSPQPDPSQVLYERRKARLVLPFEAHGYRVRERHT